MSRTTLVPAAVLALLVLATGSFAAEPSKRIPILLDTDIAADVDDAFALALLLTSPEFDLRGVTTVAGDARVKAMLACRFLDAVGRPGVPVAAGESTTSAKNEGMYQYGLRASPKRPVKEGAVEFLHEQLQADPGEITLIAVGPLTNVAALLEKHPESAKSIKRIVLMGGAICVGYNGQAPAEPEWNIKSDVAAARRVFTSGVPLVVAPLDATVSVKLTAPRRKKLFAADSLLCKHLQGLYELWGKETPVLYDSVAAALALDGAFPLVKMAPMRLEVADDGATRAVEGEPNARVAVGIEAEKFLDWHHQRVTGLPLEGDDLPEQWILEVARDGSARLLNYPIDLDALAQLRNSAADDKVKSIVIRADSEARTGDVQEIIRRLHPVSGEFSLAVLDAPKAKNVSPLRKAGGMPSSVHVSENYETEIERRWWLSGERVRDGEEFACRAMLCRNFDQKMGDRYKIHRAVIFNPVPGPPMGPRTRLSFRYKIDGADSLRVQIFSLSNGYHRFLTVTDLKQDAWREAVVDMTDARRPDGSGGPLSEDERIDDIQFYTDAEAELLIDDIVLFDEAAKPVEKPFPENIVFTGGFDTGRQGQEWPGRFEIVAHEAPRTWKAAQSVVDEETGESVLNVSLRGRRPLAEVVRLRFRYYLTGGDQISLVLQNGETESSLRGEVQEVVQGRWTETTVEFPTAKGRQQNRSVEEVRFVIPKGASLRIDDLLLYQPAD
ncbi:MAG: nucleoside hydrolase [Pirellulaceae bacterium]